MRWSILDSEVGQGTVKVDTIIAHEYRTAAPCSNQDRRSLAISPGWADNLLDIGLLSADSHSSFWCGLSVLSLFVPRKPCYIPCRR